MTDKTTGELRQELMSKSNLDSYLRENQSSFSDSNVAELLTALFDEKNISKADLARKANISEVYLHQVFAGRRTPSRDRLLCLCAGMDATLEETQALLKHASYAQLYPKLKRDAIIIHGLVHHTNLNTINEPLFAENEKTLF